jgi:signal transduction histidine kinase
MAPGTVCRPDRLPRQHILPGCIARAQPAPPGESRADRAAQGAQIRYPCPDTGPLPLMNKTPQDWDQLGELALYLKERREAILQSWRLAAQADPKLTTVSVLSRSQFFDHIPDVLDAFAHRLEARNVAERSEAATEQRASAAGHGLHRWQQGYQQREVMYEWRHLHLCLVDELETYSAMHPHLAPAVMPTARRALAQLCSEGVCESATQYKRMQQMEAAGRLRDLEQAMADLKELELQRAQVWREAAHDLRGNLGIVTNAATLLHLGSANDPARSPVVDILQRGVASLHSLLDDLMSLARLEAGHEQRRIEPFDAAAQLGELAVDLQSFARERGLFLHSEGPPALPVEGDRVKVRRIAQNLLLNGLKYTDHGGVMLKWDRVASGTVERWSLCVQDTGPGFADGGATPMVRALKEATEEAHSVETAQRSSDTGSVAKPAATLVSQSLSRPLDQMPGEGIGLSIVKRLCDLLDANIELETAGGKGSTFRVVFPVRYEG